MGWGYAVGRWLGVFVLLEEGEGGRVCVCGCVCGVAEDRKLLVVTTLPSYVPRGSDGEEDHRERKDVLF